MKNETDLPIESVSVKTKISFSLGGLANGLFSGLPFANLTFFYQTKLGANADLLVIGWMIFAIWNTINDPIASYFIDNTRTKIGRRIPFIRYGSVFYGLAFIFCWIPISPLDNQIGLFINFIAALFLLDTMFSIVGTCYFSLPNEIAITAKQRASIGVYSAIFGFINLILTLFLPVILLTGQEGTHPLFVPIIFILGIFGAFLLYITSYGIRENLFAQLQEHEGFIKGLRLTLKNKPFWILMIPAFCIATLFPMFQTGLLYYFDYNIAGQLPLFVLLAFILGIALGLIFFLKKIAIWQPKKTMTIGMIVTIIGLMLFFFIGNFAILASIPSLLIGLGYAGGVVSNPALMGDAIDNDELITGNRREAVYGGVNAVVTKPALSVANSLYLIIIEGFGFVEPLLVNGVNVKQIQPFLALVGILVAFCVVPAIFLVLSVIALRWFPLDGPEWIKKKKFIMELHEKKEEEYLRKITRDKK